LAIAAGTPRCHTSQLELAQVALDGAAGNLLEIFEMRNKSASSCWVYGFVGFQPLDGQGRPIPTTLAWTTESFFGVSDPASRILLPAGTAPLQIREPNFWSVDGRGHAFFDTWTNDVSCDISQHPVVTLEIWPPDETMPLKITARVGNVTFAYCGGIALNPLQIQPFPHQR
jgi:Protein of unknown function (DUF4232)